MVYHSRVQQSSKGKCKRYLCALYHCHCSCSYEAHLRTSYKMCSVNTDCKLALPAQKTTPASPEFMFGLKRCHLSQVKDSAQTEIPSCDRSCIFLPFADPLLSQRQLLPRLPQQVHRTDPFSQTHNSDLFKNQFLQQIFMSR